MNPSKHKKQAVPLPPRRPRLPEQNRNDRATIRPPLIPLAIPHVTQGCESIRSHDTRPMYRVPQVPQKTQLSELSFLPSLAFLRAGTQKMYGFGFIASFAFVLRPPISAAAKASG